MQKSEVNKQTFRSQITGISWIRCQISNAVDNFAARCIAFVVAAIVKVDNADNCTHAKSEQIADTNKQK